VSKGEPRLHIGGGGQNKANGKKRLAPVVGKKKKGKGSFGKKREKSQRAICTKQNLKRKKSS